jgi:hypothetical protein
MLQNFTRGRAWRLALSATLLPLALGACGDDDPSDPDDDNPFNGTWAFTEDGQTSYVRITDDAVEIFGDAGACFITVDYEIVSSEDGVLTLDDGTGAVEWTVDEVGNNLVVEDEDGISTTLTPSSQNLSTLPSCEPYDPDVDDFARPACSSLQQLAIPGSVTGEITPGDPRFYDLSWFDVYRIQIAAETDVNITMAADNQDELDAYLSIYDADGVEVVDDDDSADGSDSRVQTTLTPGCYYVVAGSYSGDDEGETGGGYTLTASTTLVSDFPHATCSAIPEVTVGGSVSGTLQDGDPRWSDTDQSWYDLWSLQLDTEQTVTITMEEDGSGIDTYMKLYNSLGTIEIDADDDIDGTNFNSQIADITLAPGCYIIVANSYEGDDDGEVGGAYTLSVD